MGQETQVAVFIDYDNIEISVEETFGKNIDVDWLRIFQHAAQMGRVTVRRAYADWGEAKDRQRALLNLGVELVHVSSKRGKNAADIRIVIDALELLHSENSGLTHIILVSGDGDFVELVHRLRAHGKHVIGIGISNTTADYLVTACDKFIFYDKWQGVGKFKKAALSVPPQNQTPPAPKPNHNGNGSAPKTQVPMATTPEGKFEQYINLLSAKKIRMSDGNIRPLVIYKIYELIKNSGEQLTFNQLKEQLEKAFSGNPNVQIQAALDIAHQLFYTFCFEFDPESHERILNRKMAFATDIQKAADLLDKCDSKLLQLLVSELGSAEHLDKEIMARLLYGGIRSSKVIGHIAELIVTV